MRLPLRSVLLVPVLAMVVPACGPGGGGGGGGSSGGGGGAGNSASNLPPTVTMLQPINGAIFTPASPIELEAVALDTDGFISRVDFFDGSSRLGSAAASPFIFEWNGALSGSHSITARATDNLGTTTISVPILIFAIPPGLDPRAVDQPPSVAILSPLGGSSFPLNSPITIEAQVVDAEGPIAKVDFWDGLNLIGTIGLPPFKIVWSGAKAGHHSLVAVASDQQATSNTSLPVSIFVAPPTPAAGPSLSPTWFPLGPINPPVDFRDVFFADTIHGWAVSSNGIIVSTDDGGLLWVIQSSGTDAWLESLQFVSASTGWVVGGSGTILRTTDGGDLWVPQLSRTTAFLAGVSFVSTTQGWVCGHGGTILKTTDGGSLWTAQESRTTEDLEAIHFLHALRGWAVGTSGTILSTTDGGVTWNPQHFEFVSSTGIPIVPSFTDLRFVSSLNGVIVGVAKDGGIILNTVDGGANWIPHGPFQSGGAPAGLEGLSFGDAFHAWAVGAFGTIWATADGGTTWTQQPSGTIDHLSSVFFIDSSTGWAVGTRGAVQKTLTGGVVPLPPGVPTTAPTFPGVTVTPSVER